jgi:uncharacterized protein (TIGR00725 family)
MPQAVRYVGVIGKGRDCPPAVRRLAVYTGAALSQLHPHVALVCGGLGGVMDGAAQGMTGAGGIAIGLIPHPARSVSPHLTYAIRLGLPVLYRDITTAHAADVMIVLPGHHGTLIEAWAAADRGVPLVAVGCHTDQPTGYLPFSHYAAPADLPALVGGILGLEAGRAD